MDRHIGDITFPSTLQVKKQEMLDPRMGVDKKSDLIADGTFPSDGSTIYMKEGMLVSVKEEQSIYMLVNLSKIKSADYSGWYRMNDYVDDKTKALNITSVDVEGTAEVPNIEYATTEYVNTIVSEAIVSKLNERY